MKYRRTQYTNIYKIYQNISILLKIANICDHLRPTLLNPIRGTERARKNCEEEDPVHGGWNHPAGVEASWLNHCSRRRLGCTGFPTCRQIGTEWQGRLQVLDSQALFVRTQCMNQSWRISKLTWQSRTILENPLQPLQPHKKATVKALNPCAKAIGCLQAVMGMDFKVCIGDEIWRDRGIESWSGTDYQYISIRFEHIWYNFMALWYMDLFFSNDFCMHAYRFNQIHTVYSIYILL